MTGPWAVLGIEPTSDRLAIRRAYAAKLKGVHPEDDPRGFQALRAAYERVLKLAERGYTTLEWSPAYEEERDGEEEEADEDDLGFQATNEDPEPKEDAPPRALAWTEKVDPEPEAGPEPEPEKPRTIAWTEKVDPEPDPEPEPKPRPKPRAWTEKVVAAPLQPTPLELEAAAHEADCQRLGRLLTAAVEPDPAEVEALGREILAAPAMEQLAVFLRTETWLAGLIASNVPRSDPLVPGAVARFEWKIDERDREANPAVAHVVRRGDDLRWRSQLELKTHPLHRAWRLLNRGPGRGDAVAALLLPGRLNDLRVLLGQLRRDHPGLEVNFTPGVLTAWETYLDRPRPPALAIWGVLAFGALAAVPASSTGAAPDPQLYLRFWPALTLAGFVALGFKQFALDYPAWQWRRRWRFSAPPWVAVGWAPAALAAMGLAALLPRGLPGTIAVGAASLGVFVWSAVTGERLAPGRSRWPWLVRLVARNGVVAVLWLMMTIDHRSGARPVAGAMAAAAACFAWSFGEQGLIDLWERRLSRAQHYGAMAFLGLVAITLAVLQAPLEARPPPTPLALGLTAFAILHRLPASGAQPFAPNFNVQPRNIFGLIWLLMVGGSLLAGLAASVAVVVIALSPWVIIGGSSWGILRAALRERELARRERRTA